MKTKLIILFLSFFAYNCVSYAQDTLTKANSAPVYGGMVNYIKNTSSFATSAIQQLPKNMVGTGQDWNFSNFNLTDTLPFTYRVDSFQYGLYSSWLMAPSELTDATDSTTDGMYFTPSDTALNFSGLYAFINDSTYLLTPNSDNMWRTNIITYPFTNNDSIYNIFLYNSSLMVYENDTTIVLGGSSNIVAAHFVTKAIGVGTLETPKINSSASMTINNVLLVKTRIFIDSGTVSNQSGTKNISRTSFTRYSFYNTDSSRYPLMKFICDSVYMGNNLIAKSATWFNSGLIPPPSAAMGDTTSSDSISSIYSGFTPNGDGKNDVWIINGIAKTQPNKVVIFDRWGQIIWQANNYDNKKIVWDGLNLSGEVVPNGIYFYSIKTKDKIYKGWVSLMR